MQRRYRKLIQEHLNVAQRVSAGLSALPGVGSAFASTQAAWRFLNNPRVSLSMLAEPLLEAARQACSSSNSSYALVAHDASSLNFPTHECKADRATLTHQGDIGYQMMTALLIDAESGTPVAPVEVRLSAERKVYSTREPAPRVGAVLHDEVLPTMNYLRDQAWDKMLLHVLVREFDSVPTSGNGTLRTTPFW